MRPRTPKVASSSIKYDRPCSAPHSTMVSTTDRILRRLAPRACSICHNWYFPRKSCTGAGWTRPTSSAPLHWGTGFETPTWLHFNHGRFRSHGLLWSVPVHRYRVVVDPGVRRFILPHCVFTHYLACTGPPLGAYTRARSVQKHRESRGQSRKQKGAGGSVRRGTHSGTPRASSRIFITESLVIY